MRKSFLIVAALLLLVLQSCTVYDKYWITMDEAIQMEKKQKVKLVDPDSKKSVREYTILEGVKIYGDTLFGGQLPRDIVTGYKRPFHIRYTTPIPEQYRSYQVYLENKPITRTLTVLGITIPFALVIGSFELYALFGRFLAWLLL